MKTTASGVWLLALFLFLCLITQGFSISYSTEDESRFRSEPYKQTAPGFLSPAEYVERTKVILHSRYRYIVFRTYFEPDVTHRFYFDAPPRDREMICVRFEYKEPVRMPVSAMKRLPAPVFPCRAAFLVLFRKGLSKVYVNEVYYQEW